jgi:hypothetical protein
MLIGYRAWLPVLDQNLKPALQSFTADYLWQFPVETGPPPVGESDFDERISKATYDRDASLGFFSFNHSRYLSFMLYEDDMEDSISGITQPFGVVRKFEKGFRSQCIQILALSLHAKCCIAECSSSAGFWITHLDNHRLTGLCAEHENLKESSWMESLCGESPAIMTSEALFSALGNKYQCDIINHSELTETEKDYGSW